MSDALSGRVRCERDGAVARIIFDNQSRRNALSMTMLAEFAVHLDALAVDRAVRAVILTGAGDAAFIAGADVRELEGIDDGVPKQARLEAELGRVLELIDALPQPVIAEIRGHCIGAGLAVAAAADLRVCSPTARFVIPAGRMGIGYPLAAARRLRDIVGLPDAAWILMTGDALTASQAHAIRLVQVVAEDVMAEASAIAGRVAANAPLSVTAAKLALRASSASEISAELADAAQAAIERTQVSSDLQEGARSWLERRPPEFTGT